ncbi:MAG: 50S ribosomal protein L18 [Verrucomicrobia bacterium]|nr:MAG: 50S ribosomal protein L18 [Verrucomicrobiota bacterium]
MNLRKKTVIITKRKNRVRKNISGTQEKPRLSVHFSHKHIYAQCINDDMGVTLCSLSTLSKDFKQKNSNPNVATATLLGKDFGLKAKAIGIEKAVFDRGSKRFHGAIKAFADAARESIIF